MPNHALAVLDHVLKLITQSNIDDITNKGYILNNLFFIKSKNLTLFKSQRLANKKPDWKVKIDNERYAPVRINELVYNGFPYPNE